MIQHKPIQIRHLPSAIVKENSVSRQSSTDDQIWFDSLTNCNSKGGQYQPHSSIDLFRYGWIHLLPAIVKGDSVSRQLSIDLFRYGWIHLLPAIVKGDSVSRQLSIDLFRYGWIYLHAAIGKGTVSDVNLVKIYSDMV